MLSEEEKKDIEQAVSNILRGIDIESSALILKIAIMDNYIISKGRVNILKIATRQILNFIEEYKNKGYLDVVREKVKANEEITKLQKENKQKDKQIDLMAEMIDELSEYYTRYWGKNNEFCKEDCIKKDIDCKDCVKQYFKEIARKEK